MACPLLPLYQLRINPNGTWRARVFNLPPHAGAAPPTLPFLRELAAQSGNWHSGWHEDPEEKLTVLRLAGGSAPRSTRCWLCWRPTASAGPGPPPRP